MATQTTTFLGQPATSSLRDLFSTYSTQMSWCMARHFQHLILNLAEDLGPSMIAMYMHRVAPSLILTHLCHIHSFSHEY